MSPNRGEVVGTTGLRWGDEETGGWLTCRPVSLGCEGLDVVQGSGVTGEPRVLGPPVRETPLEEVVVGQVRGMVRPGTEGRVGGTISGRTGLGPRRRD